MAYEYEMNDLTMFRMIGELVKEFEQWQYTVGFFTDVS